MPDCENCKGTEQSVSYIVHEGAMARMERTVKRLWVTILVLIAFLVGSNAMWIDYENSFEDVVTTIEADATDGGNAIANNDGEVVYSGES